DAALVEQFRAERDADYEALAEAIRERSGSGAAEDLPARVARSRKRFDEIAGIDFFGAPGRQRAEKLLRTLEAADRRRPSEGRRPGQLAGRTWATRRGVHIDRIASAWLIRRFIDPKARFQFIDPKEPPRAGELRFDIVGGDFSHEGDGCTFETLLSRMRLAD